MATQIELSFDGAELTMLDEIGRRLRTDRWAAHVTVVRLLSDWQALAMSADRYVATIDDYTNDLTARDGLEIALGQCQGLLHAKLKASIEQADREFLARTRDDDDNSSGSVLSDRRVRRLVVEAHAGGRSIDQLPGYNDVASPTPKPALPGLREFQSAASSDMS